MIWSFKTFSFKILAMNTCIYSHTLGGSLVAQMVKNLPAMWETCVQSLGHEDPLEDGVATHSHRESDMTEHTHKENNLFWKVIQW